MLLDPSLPRPEAAQLEAARDAAADEPLWQAILTDLLAAP
jgi:hypothetical protein